MIRPVSGQAGEAAPVDIQAGKGDIIGFKDGVKSQPVVGHEPNRAADIRAVTIKPL